ncbi:MAG: single-stranded DNA-binding protein [Cytophagales bacterium]|nr:single-stranded DNA-binding protein [Cytophagales bacterium]
MAGVNKVILIGNLGKDPEVRYLESGVAVANVTLATTERYKDRTGNQVENTEWHDLEMWEGLAKIAEQYLKKGNSIYVEGKIKTDSWQDDQGNKKYRTKIRVQQMTMLGGSGGGNTGGAALQSNEPMSEPAIEASAPATPEPTPATTEPTPAPKEDNSIDDLPF